MAAALAGGLGILCIENSILVRPRFWKNAEEVRAVFLELGIEISDGAEEVIQKVTYPRKVLEEDVRLVAVMNRSLGFDIKMQKRESEDKAVEYGLYPCTETYAFDLCVALVTQKLLSSWSTCLVMMDPIMSRDYLENYETYQSIFGIKITDGRLRLSSHTGFSERGKDPERVWLFCTVMPSNFAPSVFKAPAIRYTPKA